MSWREHADGEGPGQVHRENGTRLERAVGWLLTYPVRTLVIALVVLIVLTLVCGL